VSSRRLRGHGQNHIGRIFGKLDLRDRAATIVYAYDNGIVAPR
jgi:DNA-binding NarL/FixJ family response regulator